MDLSSSELIDAGLETPINEENLTEDEKLLMEKDEQINASEPWSAERSVLLQEAVQFHQDKLIEDYLQKVWLFASNQNNISS